MTTFDMTAVAIALPSLNEDLDISPHQGEWLIFSYAAAMIALGLPAGRYVDQSDLRGTFVFGVLGFAAASMLAGFAGNLTLLIIFRVLQGAFGAVITSTVPVIATRSVPLEQRGRALSIIGVLGPLGAVSGPGLGGVLTELWGWPAIFFVVVPFSLGAVAVALANLNRLNPMTLPQGGLVVETVVVGIAFLALFGALSMLADPEAAGFTIVLLGLVAVGSLLMWWRLPGFAAVRRSLGERMVAACVLSLALITIASGTFNYLPPFAFQVFHGWSPAEVGAVLLFQPLAMGLAGPFSGYLTDKWKPMWTAVIGVGGVLAGSLLMLFGVGSGGVPVLVIALVLFGLGLGLFAGPNQTLLMTSAPPDLRGTSAALSGLGRQLGLSLGAGLATIVWLGSGGDEYLAGEGLQIAFVVAPVAAVCALASFLLLTRRPSTEAPAGRQAPAGTPTGSGENESST
ncbi:MFS transporter [Nocardiopsis alba]